MSTHCANKLTKEKKRKRKKREKYTTDEGAECHTWRMKNWNKIVSKNATLINCHSCWLGIYYEPEVNSSNVCKSWSAWTTRFYEVTRRQRHGTDSTHQRCISVLHWGRHQYAHALGEIATPWPASTRHKRQLRHPSMNYTYKTANM